MRCRAKTQGGLTTLVTVGVLFFIVAMVAAYANRNLIIEQRVAYNYSQLSRASEGAAQAQARMLSWLNSDQLNEACELDAAGPGTLRERLLRIDANGRLDVPDEAKANPASRSPWSIVCDRRHDEAWRCHCPVNLRPEAHSANLAGQESLLLRLRPLADGLGRIGVSAAACNLPSGACQNEPDDEGERVSSLHMLTLLSALKMPPLSALVVRGEADLGAGMAVVNADAQAGGLGLQAGGAVRGVRTSVLGPTGSPSVASVVENDGALAGLAGGEFFRQFFGLSPSDYQRQPALRQLACEAEACSAALQALVASGAQMVATPGNLSLHEVGALGSVARPLIMLVGGDLHLEGALDFKGLVFVTGSMTWRNGSGQPSRIQGALLVAGSLGGDAQAAVVYDRSLLRALQQRAGSYMTVPGSQWSRVW